MAVLQPQIGDHGLLQVQVGLPLQGALHVLLVLPAVGLGAERVDGRTLAPVEHPVLDAAAVGSLGHFAAQGVQLPDQLPFAGAADGRIAGHVAHRVQIDGEDHGAASQPGRGQARLDPRVACADDGHVVCACQIFHEIPASFAYLKSVYCTKKKIFLQPRSFDGLCGRRAVE